MTNEELRKLAERATPGPWVASGVTSRIGDMRFMFINVEPLGEVARIPLPDRPAKGYAPTICDQQFIAAASPDVVIELLDEIASLRADLRKIANGDATQGEIEWARKA